MGSNSKRTSRTFFSSVLRENWSGDPRKRMKYKKLLTRKLLIDFLRYLGMPEMKIKGHIGLEIVFGMISYHIGMHLSITLSVHRPKKNRASEKGGCMHTVGSISLHDHAIRLSEELGRYVYVDEDTGQFVDDRSRRTHEEFEARLSQARSDAASSVGESQLIPLDPTEEQRLRSRCWVADAGPKRKGRLYGIGDLAHSYKCGSGSFMQHTQGSSSCAEDATEINRLREELR
ncbi:hypothetical protein GmHk_10G028995 [Glycine max]|nr:hypothetical protein GmHk_10G028995 [Glycine max]